MKQVHLSLIFLYALCLLSACGGGGSGSAPPPPPPAATHLSVAAPATATVGTAVNVTVTALDASNNAVTTYSGAVHFTSTDGQAGLPGNSMLTNGTGTLQVTLNTPGSQTITATDTVMASLSGTSNSIQVSAPVVGFTATGSMLSPRESHRAILLNDGKVLVVGGMHWAALGCPPIDLLCLSALKSAELFDPAAGVFTVTGDMSAARVFHTATSLGNGKVLVAGGDDRLGTTYLTAELFDPATGIFTSTGSMMVTRSGHTATLLTDGTVLVTGGGSGATGATAETFDPSNGQFTPTGNMTTARFFHTATLLSDGTVLIAGGQTDTGTTSTAEIYNPATHTFSPTGSMSVVRSSHTATLLTSGEVLVTGGASSNGVTATAELFDPVTGIFTAARSMQSPRELHTATRLADGSVLVAGGIDGNTALSSAELFNPANGGFTLARDMETERYEHAATLLANGEVLITGGINFDNTARLNSIATAELSGSGAEPGAVTLRPQAMSFFCHSGVGPPAGCSPPEAATLTNTGSSPVYVLDVVISPPSGRFGVFSQTSNCPEVLSPGQSCNIAVSFDGSAGRNGGKTTTTATLYVSDTASGSPQKVMLTGTATAN